MAKVLMTCGRICSGKSTYSENMRWELHAVILSVDEITLALFGQDAGETLDTYVERAESYLFEKSVQIVETGINVILDWGFWTKKERDYAREFYRSRGIECEMHYIEISEEEWYRRLEKRNRAVEAGECSAYFVDDGLAAKFASIFEPPAEAEEDIIVIRQNDIRA